MTRERGKRWITALVAASWALMSGTRASAQAPSPSGSAPPGTSAPAASTGSPPASPSASPASTSPNASPPSTASAATLAALRARGAAAAAAKDYEECIRHYSAALALQVDGATAGELGLCEEVLGRNVAAHDHLLMALEREVRAAPAKVRARWKLFRAAALRVDMRVARVALFVTPLEAEVLLDGKSLGTQVSGTYFAVEPGTHTWVARLPHNHDAQVTVTATARGGSLPHIGLTIPSEPTPAPPPPSSTPPAPAAPSTCAACEAPRLPEMAPCEAADGLPMTVDLCDALRIRWRRMDPTLGLVAGGLLSLGFTADVGPGFFLGGEAHWRREEDWGFQVGAEARLVIPTKAGFAPTNPGVSQADARLDLMVLELAVVPCARYKWVLGCVFIAPGMTLDFGPLTETPEWGGPGSGPTFLFGVGPRLAADIPLTERFGVRAFADLRFNPGLPPTTYTVNKLYKVWEEPVVSGFLGLGIWFR